MGLTRESLWRSSAVARISRFGVSQFNLSAGMKQVFCSRTTDAGTASTQFTSPTALRAWSSIEVNGSLPWAVSGTFRNLKVDTPTAPGGVASVTYTFRKNAVSQSLACTITGTNTANRDATNSVSVSPGDLIAIQRSVSGSPSVDVTRCSLEFQGSNPYESGYGGKCDVALSATLTRWTGPFSQANGSWNGTAGANIQNVVAAAGTITALYINLDGTPGAGTSYKFQLYKNGVLQDGSAGTINTVLTISNTSTSGNLTFNLGVSPGDLVYIECVPQSTPTARSASFGVRFMANTNGESQFCGSPNVSMSAAATQYAIPSSMRDSDAYNATETVRNVIGGVTSFTLKNMQAILNGAPSASTSYRLNLRKNGAAAGPSITISNTATTGSDLSNQATITDADTFSYEEAPTGTPNARASRWSWVQYIAPAGIDPVVTWADIDQTDWSHWDLIWGANWQNINFTWGTWNELWGN